MASFNKIRKKIQSTCEQIGKNFVDINNKKRVYDTTRKSNQNFKVPEILYDSGWFVSNSEEASDSEHYVETDNEGSKTVQKGQRSPIVLNYMFLKELDVSEEYLPFIKSDILIENYPELQGEGIFEYAPMAYASTYYQMKGDADILYQGDSPANRYFGETARIAGDILTSHLSKWYKGTLKYSYNGDSYELRNGYITTIFSQFNSSPVERFTCSAIDGLSSSAVLGEGTYYNDGVTTKNVDKNVSIFGSNPTSVYASGQLYKNDVYQATYSIDSPHYVFFSLVVGAPTLTSFVYIYDDSYRLWYSSSRAREFRFDLTTKLLTNFPITDDYQSGTLPYTSLSAKVNPDPYPLTEEDNETFYKYRDNKEMWAKVTDNKYRFIKNGYLVLSLPSQKESTTNVSFVNETYSHSGNTYARDSANRDDKVLPIYEPEDIGVKVRLILSLDLSKDYSNIQNHEIIS